MTTTQRNRMKRLAAILPPPAAPRAPDALTPEQLRAMPTDELWCRFQQRMETPEALARRAELEALSDEELLAVWARRP